MKLMKKLLIFSLASVILLAGLVTGLVSTFVSVSAQNSSQFNPQQSLQNALTQIAKYFPNDVISVHILLNDGTASNWQVTTSNGQVASFTSGAPSNPTVTISSSQSTLEGIASANDQTSATIQAINSGSITITSTSIVNQIKLFFFSIFTRIFSLFGSK